MLVRTRAVLRFKVAFLTIYFCLTFVPKIHGQGQITLYNHGLFSNGNSYHVPIWVDLNSNGTLDLGEGIGTYALSLGTTATLALYEQNGSFIGSGQFRPAPNSGSYLVQPVDLIVPGYPAGERAPLIVKAWIGPSYETATFRGSWYFLSDPLGGSTATTPIVPPYLEGWGDPSGVGYALHAAINPPDDTAKFITAAEYFWDTDPGLGNGIVVPVIQGEVARISFNANTSSLAAGSHILGLRTRNASGVWGDVTWSPIFIQDENATTGPNPTLVSENSKILTGSEYVWDTDPGAGNGASVVLSPGDKANVSFNPSLSSLAAGTHRLGFRVKDSSQRWSEISWLPISLYDANTVPPGGVALPANEGSRELVAAEYFWDADPGIGSATAVSIPPGETVRFGPPSTNELKLDFSTKPGGPHSIGFRVKDAGGKWSATETVPISVPGAPIARFNGVYYPNNIVVANNGSSFQVSLDTRFVNGVIYYSLNGESPIESGEIYEGPFSVPTPFVLRAIAFSEDSTLKDEMDRIVSVFDSTHGGGNMSIASTSIDELTGITTAAFQATSANGWTFLTWAGDSSSTSANITMDLNGPKSFEAVFGTTLTTSPNPLGVITRSSTATFYPWGTTVRLSAAPYAGNYFRFWGGAANLFAISPMDFTITNANPTISAAFAILTGSSRALNVLIEGQGTVTKTPQQQNYPNNSTVTLTAVPANGHHFLWWTGDVPSVLNPLTVSMTNSKTVTAVFEADAVVNKFPLTSITSPANGSVFLTPVNLTITADSTDQDGYIVQTAFLTNGTQIGVSASSPFSFTWNNAPTGEYVLRSVSTDNRGAVSTSAPVNIKIQRPANQLPIVALLAPQAADFLQSPTNVFLLAQATDPDGSVVKVDFFGNGLLLGTSTNRSPTNTYSFVWTNAPVGADTIFAQATDNENAPVNSAQVTITVQPPIPTTYKFENATYSISESVGSISLKILKTGLDAGTVNFATTPVSATPSKDYVSSLGTISFAAGEQSKTINITLLNEYVPDGDKSFEVRLSSSKAGELASPSTAVITTIDDDAALEHNSYLEYAFVGDRPTSRGRLQVYLEPEAAQGQWRFPWELLWRNNGDIASDLDPGEYPITFRGRPSYQTPEIVTNSVPGGATVVRNYAYQFDATLVGGSLTVAFSPLDLIDPALFGWRFLGDNAYHGHNEKVTGISPGVQVVEFRPISGWVRPHSREVLIQSGVDTKLNVFYTLESSTPPNAITPTPLPNYSFIHSGQTVLPRQPFPLVGQLRSAAGYGSGIAVREHVVLTAAHVLFDEATLGYVTSVDWFGERHAGDYEPRPISARGWYVNTNYLYERTRERTELGLSPGVSTFASQQWDFAAVFFDQRVARGGFSGYLLSDNNSNEWLMSSSQKELLGYPLYGTAEGKMHWTLPSNYTFSQIFGRIFSTPGFLSYPGNSGGPICVQFTRSDSDIIYFPAAIYLGNANNRAIARAIDSDVASLINRAESSAILGVNFLGGGADSFGGGGFATAQFVKLSVQITPTQAVAAGAGWRLVGGPSFSSSSATLTLPTGVVQIEFKEIPGYTKPAPIQITLVRGQDVSIPVSYTASASPNQPRITSIIANAVTITLRARRLTAGPAALESSHDLNTWTELRTVNLPADLEIQFDVTRSLATTTFFRLKNQ